MKWIKIGCMLIVVLGLIGVLFAYAKKSNVATTANSTLVQQKHWELPKVLKEVSGIAWLGNNTLAMVQDEEGIIFKYDLVAEKIVAEFVFAGDGDYEGLAVVGTTAYVLRSDGVLFEVFNFESEHTETKMHTTLFREKHNIESLCFDAEHNRLLLVAKDKDLKNKDQKGIYAFDLETHTFNPSAVYRISLQDEVLAPFRDKDIEDTFRPSDLAIHPVTKALYILEGVDPKILIMENNGKLKKIHKLSKKQLTQPEGITFSTDGTLYIASEAGNKKRGVVMQMAFD